MTSSRSTRMLFTLVHLRSKRVINEGRVISTRLSYPHLNRFLTQQNPISVVTVSTVTPPARSHHISLLTYFHTITLTFCIWAQSGTSTSLYQRSPSGSFQSIIIQLHGLLYTSTTRHSCISISTITPPVRSHRLTFLFIHNRGILTFV